MENDLLEEEVETNEDGLNPIEEATQQFRRMAEAGIVPTMDQWDKEWSTAAQNLWLEARQRVKEIDLAFALRMLREELTTGTASEDMLYDELTEEQQGEILRHRVHQDVMLSKMGA